MTKKTMNNENAFSEIELRTIHHDGRDIAYSVSPDNGSTPVLFFYPAGGNRRMLLSFRALFADLQFICVNRPGKGGTSPAKENDAKSHLTTAIQDAAVVLDQLRVDKVSLVCMCAGTPFCFTFAARYPERTTGRLVGISCWVQPADCSYANTKTAFFLGTKMPTAVSPMVGVVFASIGSSLTSFPTGMVLGALRGKLSTDEREAFDEKYKDRDDFADMMNWMQRERGGVSSDMLVLLGSELLDYQAVVDSQKSIMLWHGTSDTLVRYAGAEWLATQGLSSATLNAVPDGTHQGCNFLLHSSIVDSLKALGQD